MPGYFRGIIVELKYCDIAFPKSKGGRINSVFRVFCLESLCLRLERGPAALICLWH